MEAKLTSNLISSPFSLQALDFRRAPHATRQSSYTVKRLHVYKQSADDGNVMHKYWLKRPVLFLLNQICEKNR